MAVQAYTDWAALRAAGAGSMDGDVAYAKGNKYVWDGSSNLTDDGGAVIDPSAGTSTGRWINQGRLLELRDFAPGLTDGSADVSSHLAALFDYQGFMYMTEPNVQYLLENTVHIPDGGGIISVFPTAGSGGSTKSTNPGVLPGAPKFILDDGITGFTSTLVTHNITGGSTVDLPTNYRGVRFENFAIIGGRVQIDTGIASSVYIQNMFLQDFSGVGLIMVHGERHTLRDIWCNLSPETEFLPSHTATAGFSFADWHNSDYSTDYENWAGYTDANGYPELTKESIWIHRTEMTSCGTFAHSKVDPNTYFHNAVIIGNHKNVDPAARLIQFNLRRFVAYGTHKGSIFDGSSVAVPDPQVRESSFEHVLPDLTDNDGTPTPYPNTALYDFDWLVDVSFRQARDGQLNGRKFIDARIASECLVEQCRFQDNPIDITNVSNSLSITSSRGELTVGTPSISAATVDGDYKILDKSVTVGDVEITGPFAVNGTADIEDTALEILYSLGGTNAVGANLDYVEQSRLSLEAGFRKSATMPSSGPLSLDLCTLTAISGTAAGRITVSVFKANQTAINEVNFKGITTQSAITAVQNYDNGGASGGCSIDSISTSTTSGVHTISATVSGFTADEDVIFYVDVDIQGLKPDITVL